MKLILMGAKLITSKKTQLTWMILHVAFSDPSYLTGCAIENIIVDPTCVIGEVIEGSTVIINRSPSGKSILSVELRQDQ